MKCPKCGFVNYPGAGSCKKCEQPLASTAGSESGPSVLPLFGARPAAPGSPSSSPRAATLPPPWREELAARVESFRRRRARLKQAVDPATADEPQSGLDFEFARELENRLEEEDFEKTGAALRILTPAAVEAGELSLNRPPPEADPVEILVEPAPLAPEGATPGVLPLGLPVAPLGRRFLAGVADTVILLLAAGLFALVFWRAGGSLSRQPLNFLILALIAAFFIFVYFGLFTALTGSTPGLLWNGLEVRSFDGEYPGAREAAWRAFGYLISIAGLMLGFVWPLVDSEKLSWHDRISNTFLTLSPRRS